MELLRQCRKRVEDVSRGDGVRRQKAGMARKETWGELLNFSSPWRKLWANRYFVQQITLRNIQTKFKGSFLGAVWLLVFPLFTGLLTAILAQLALFVIEFLFDVSTTMSLLIYSDFNHPLLKRLQFEAPGTYHHSLVVSTLAEAAAKEIGANPIKARVCALFHDVGKLSHPDYFTENNNGESKHKDLMPKISALIILNHVKEGLELARKYKLKKLMRDAIQQHHGTDLVYFFYKMAKDSGEQVDEHDFRYQGPTPQTKEIAILSLADACEAASRSLQKPSHGKIEELVTEIIFKRMRDHQLDAANLTFRELTVIKDSFVKTLTSMLHARVAYPKEVIPDEDDLFVDAAARKAAEQKGS